MDRPRRKIPTAAEKKLEKMENEAVARWLWQKKQQKLREKRLNAEHEEYLKEQEEKERHRKLAAEAKEKNAENEAEVFEGRYIKDEPLDEDEAQTELKAYGEGPFNFIGVHLIHDIKQEPQEIPDEGHASDKALADGDDLIVPEVNTIVEEPVQKNAVKNSDEGATSTKVNDGEQLPIPEEDQGQQAKSVVEENNKQTANLLQRGRGCPPLAEEEKQRRAAAKGPKRGRGRPPLSEEEKQRRTAAKGPKRGRGRPSLPEEEKHRRAVVRGPKRGRGRPPLSEEEKQRRAEANGSKRERPARSEEEKQRRAAANGPKRSRGRPPLYDEEKQRRAAAKGPKRGRGRPTLSEEEKQRRDAAKGPKRGRGRPRKQPIAHKEDTIVTNVAVKIAPSSPTNDDLSLAVEQRDEVTSERMVRSIKCCIEEPKESATVRGDDVVMNVTKYEVKPERKKLEEFHIGYDFALDLANLFLEHPA